MLPGTSRDVPEFLWHEWAVKDSNLRSRPTTDLQSVPFGHLGNRPVINILLLSCVNYLIFNPCLAKPTMRIELITARLQGGCSTVELRRHTIMPSIGTQLSRAIIPKPHLTGKQKQAIKLLPRKQREQGDSLAGFTLIVKNNKTIAEVHPTS